MREQRAALARLLGDDEQHRSQLREAHQLITAIGAKGHAERIRKDLNL